MDWFERRILQYVLAWGPHGSMSDEDTFPEFGMKVTQLNERFARIIAASRDHIDRLDDADRNLITRARSFHLRTHQPCAPPEGAPGGDDGSPNSPSAQRIRVNRKRDAVRPARLAVPRERPAVGKRSQQMAAVAAHAAAAHRAREVVILDGSAHSITDCFVIASGRDDEEVQAIAFGIEERMGLAGYRPNWRDGAHPERWILLDYFDIVVLVQHQSECDVDELQRLWPDRRFIRVGQRALA
jgi:ribosome-associated protein